MPLPRRSLLLMGLALPGCMQSAPVSPRRRAAADAGDPRVRSVVARVARRRVRPIADGEYPRVRTVDEARAARAPSGIAWSYPWGVTLYGMLRSTDATGDDGVGGFVLEHDRIAARYYRWLAEVAAALGDDAEARDFLDTTSLRELWKLGSLDSCGAMGTQMIDALLRRPDRATSEQRGVVDRVADWIVRRQDRLPDGTLWRPRARQGATVWIDDLYMGAAFLARWAELSGDGRALDDAARQIRNVAGRAQDADGVFAHGFFERERRRSPVKWGRGNGWAMIAAVEVLSAMPDDHAARPALLDVLRRQIDGVARLQAPSGLWRQVLDDPGMWEETSCSAAFAYGFARAAGRGWVHAGHLEAARRAFAAISARVGPDGAVEGTCQGTVIGMDADYYARRGRPRDDEHGPGLVLLAGTELLAPG